MKAPYLIEKKYLKELVPLHIIASLAEIESDAETKRLAAEVTNAMLRLRDKLSDRPIRPRV